MCCKIHREGPLWDTLRNVNDTARKRTIARKRGGSSEGPYNCHFERGGENRLWGCRLGRSLQTPRQLGRKKVRGPQVTLPANTKTAASSRAFSQPQESVLVIGNLHNQIRKLHVTEKTLLLSTRASQSATDPVPAATKVLFLPGLEPRGPGART